MAYKVMFGELGAKDLLAVSQSPSSRTYVVLSGSMPKRVVARAAPWKGVRGRGLESAFPQIAANSKRLAALSSAHREHGFAAVLKTRGAGAGSITLCPMKCAMMMRDADSGTIQGQYPSLMAAVQARGVSRPISA